MTLDSGHLRAMARNVFQVGDPPRAILQRATNFETENTFTSFSTAAAGFFGTPASRGGANGLLERRTGQYV